MKLNFFRGAALGAVTAILTLGTTAALAGTGPGANFNLGKVNKISATSTLTGSATGAMLQVTNTGTGTGASCVHATSASTAAPAIQADNSTAGPAGAFSSTAGPAATFTAPARQPPFTVNSTTAVPKLHAQFALSAGTAGSASFANTDGMADSATTAGFATGAGTAANYRVLVCGVDGASNPIALVIDTSFNDFAGIQLVTNVDSDAITTCENLGASELAEFKVTTRNTSGLGQDEPFNFAQLGN